MAWNNGEIDNAVGWGDISHATGDTSLTMGNMVTNSNSYNLMAKYKPVRHSNRGWLSYAELKATRFGFYDPVHSIGSSLPLNYPSSPNNNWEYLKPRGIGYNECMRSTDFLSAAGSSVGYNANMGCPFSLECNGTPSPSGFAVLIWPDAYGANRNGKGWNANEGISLVEFLSGGPTRFDEYYIAFLFLDNASPATNYVYVKTKVRVDSISTVEVFPFYGSDYPSGSTTYPGIPFLNQDHTSGITIIAGLLPNPAASATYAYDVTTSQDGIYSLGIQAGVDRLNENYDDSYSILGLTGGPVNTSTYPIYLSNPTTITTSGGMTWVRYNVTVGSQDGIYGLFSTPSDWGRTVSGHQTVYFNVRLNNNTGVFGTSTEPGSVGYVDFQQSGSGIYPASANNQATKLVGSSSLSSVYAWMPQTVPVASRSISVSATAYKIDDTYEDKAMTPVQINATA